MIRFDPNLEGGPPTYVKLPRSIDGGLSSIAPGRRSDCRLKDGRVIRIREGWGQAFPYGQGGADPPAFFSLWIDGRKVLSRREWKPGYDKDTEPRLVAVVVQRARLLFCLEAQDQRPIQCRAEQFDLTHLPLDAVEYPEDGKPRPPPGTVFVGQHSIDPGLCRRYLKSVRSAFDNLTSGSDDETRFAASSDIKPERAGPGLSHKLVETTLNEGGARYKVAVFSSGNHYFDGDIAVVAPSLTSTAQILDLSTRIETVALEPWPAGWAIVSGGQKSIYPMATSRYVHLNPVRIDGRLFFFAYPTSSMQKPSALLVGFSKELRPVATCQFEKIEPHF